MYPLSLNETVQIDPSKINRGPGTVLQTHIDERLKDFLQSVRSSGGNTGKVKMNVHLSIWVEE